MDGPTPVRFSPLIPLPAQQPHPQDTDGKEDVFATLFSPPTPRATPTPSESAGRSAAGPSFNAHARTTSVDSDFGAFVSVSASEDPLGLQGEPDPFSPIQTSTFFEDARVAADKRRSEVLDELLLHEDDPLYWLSGAGSGTNPSQLAPPPPSTSTSTSTSSQNASAVLLGDVLNDFDPLSAPTRSPAAPYAASDLLHGTMNRAHDSGKPPPQENELLVDVDSVVDALHDDPERRQRQRANTNPGEPTRSPSLPPSSPTRLSRPEIQTAQSSYFTPTTGLPSRWVSSFLSSTIRTPRTGPSTPPTAASLFAAPAHSRSETADTDGDGLPSHSISSSRFSTISHSAPHTRHPTHSESVDAAITHGTPFGSHVFVPPTGAPGFAGDRQWDKGFDFDRAQVERRSVRLVGRKDMTSAVLSIGLADTVRTFLPALARLPKSWTLLYSLDQHGISLNTLYTRCQDFKGGALLVVKDSGDSIFGAWMGQGIHPSKGAYYGSGESFLWQKAGADHVKVFKWTGKNDYVALCEPDYISFGGGDGRYGLWLDDTLMDGSSANCPTFENEPLCSYGTRQGQTIKFECVGLEVWGVG
ncbi:TLD-domain-containing protein [Epithele typhae]|uniref:TLD-domain-containing protein n=1 Tax=Epithele typhae TaxID=378194 RepID=UPI002008711D|nr:TLD-domain-containing protein [Epithele typhae]KAH9926650.1 TLD-domain-containing protein [Epithele typhae]